MKEARLLDLARKFQGKGIVKGGELVLTIKDAFDFAEALEKIDIAIMGVDGWYYPGEDRKYLAQDLTIDYTVDQEVLHQKTNAAKTSVSLVKHYLETLAPTSLVSFTLDISPKLDLFLGGKQLS